MAQIRQRRFARVFLRHVRAQHRASAGRETASAVLALIRRRPRANTPVATRDPPALPASGRCRSDTRRPSERDQSSTSSLFSSSSACGAVTVVFRRGAAFVRIRHVEHLEHRDSACCAVQKHIRCGARLRMDLRPSSSRRAVSTPARQRRKHARTAHLQIQTAADLAASSRGSLRLPDDAGCSATPACSRDRPWPPPALNFADC